MPLNPRRNINFHLFIVECPLLISVEHITIKTIGPRQRQTRALKSEKEDNSSIIIGETSDDPLDITKMTLYKCESCDEEFIAEATLLVHKTERSILRTREALRKAEKCYTCDVCSETFTRKMQLAHHRKTVCKITRISKRNQKFKDKVVKEKRKKRENTPLSFGPVECDICKKVFKKKKYLNVHKTLHSSARICHLCGAKFPSEYYLRIHIRRHNKEFTEFCTICKKGFYLKTTLRAHMNIHTDSKLYICDICQKSFSCRVYLKTHMKVHIQPEKRKKFKCEICKFETFYNNCYKEHLWTHTGERQIPCEFCGKLIRREYMKIHVRIHTGEKPEVCEFCGKTFGSRKYLVKHVRVHTGDRPYECDICNKRFTQRGSLTVHLRRHESTK